MWAEVHASRVEVRPVTTEFLVGDQWLIGSGLKAGDRIIVGAALQRVRQGITVTARSRRRLPRRAESMIPPTDRISGRPRARRTKIIRRLSQFYL
jgi:hypothetical protein